MATLSGTVRGRTTGWDSGEPYVNQAGRMRTVIPIQATKQRAVTRDNSDCPWSVGVINLTEREASLVMNYTFALQRERSSVEVKQKPLTVYQPFEAVREEAKRLDEERARIEALDRETLEEPQRKALRQTDPNGELPRGTRLEYNSATGAYFLIDSLGISVKLMRAETGRLEHDYTVPPFICNRKRHSLPTGTSWCYECEREGFGVRPADVGPEPVTDKVEAKRNRFSELDI